MHSFWFGKKGHRFIDLRDCFGCAKLGLARIWTGDGICTSRFDSGELAVGQSGAMLSAARLFPAARRLRSSALKVFAQIMSKLPGRTRWRLVSVCVQGRGEKRVDVVATFRVVQGVSLGVAVGLVSGSGTAQRNEAHGPASSRSL